MVIVELSGLNKNWNSPNVFAVVPEIISPETSFMIMLAKGRVSDEFLSITIPSITIGNSFWLNKKWKHKKNINTKYLFIF